MLRHAAQPVPSVPGTGFPRGRPMRWGGGNNDRRTAHWVSVRSRYIAAPLLAAAPTRIWYKSLHAIVQDF